jgi:hypothetical protein
MNRILLLGSYITLAMVFVAAASAADNTPPEGFTALFNGKDLSGWKGLLKEPNDNPATRAKLSPEETKKLQVEADELMRKTWKVENGVLVYNGRGRSLCTAKDYGDFELNLDFKIDDPTPEDQAVVQQNILPIIEAGKVVWVDNA